jgi:hypothetical protein
MTTKALQASINRGPFAGHEAALAEFFGTKNLADRFLAEYTQARDYAVCLELRGMRSADYTFPEQFWDGRLFLDRDDMYDRGINRQTLANFRRDAYVEDEDLGCDIHLLRHGRERIIVIDWTWKEDEYALDAWTAK